MIEILLSICTAIGLYVVVIGLGYVALSLLIMWLDKNSKRNEGPHDSFKDFED